MNLLIVCAVIAVIAVYFVVKLQKQETSAGQGIDADLQETLARVEKLEPVGWTTNSEHWSSGRDEGINYPGLFSGEIQKNCDYEYQEWVRNDTGPWCISMRVVQNTPDGNLETIVHSEADMAYVRVTVGSYHLWGVEYRDGSGDFDKSIRINRVAVQYVREWVRRRVLPEFEAAKAQRDSLLQGYDAELEAMRKKYLP